mgnify:FL=1
MDQRRLICAVLGVMLVSVVPGSAAAQPAEDGPEGTRWDLIGYLDRAEMVAVPWSVEATLELEGGIASGSGGCNGYSGSYELDASALTFEEVLARTSRECEGPRMAVEETFLAALSSVASLAVDDGMLVLSDAAGERLLELERPAIALTPSEVSTSETTIDELRSEADKSTARAQTIQRLRQRISKLESTVERLREQKAEARAAAPNAAERVLLEAVPARIAGTCVPRRDALPAGTVAAVQCKPKSSIVRDMAYYLMESEDASAVLGKRISDNIGRNWKGTCSDGRVGAIYDTPGPSAFACYRNDDGRANLRLVSSATNCRQLVAGGTRLKQPAVYVAVLGEDGNIGKLARWAGSKTPGAHDLTRSIDRPDERWSNMCPR